MKRLFILLLAVFLSSVLHAAPTPDLQWNRYVTDNFEILSLDDDQGKYLYDNAENMKTWVAWRWGVKDVPLQTKCRIVVAPSQELYTKLFNKKDPVWKVEEREGKAAGVMWLPADAPKWNAAVPVDLTEVVLGNFEAEYGTRLPLWCHRGMAVMNGRLTDIRDSFAVARVDVKKLLGTDRATYEKLDAAQKAAFDGQAAGFCLWVKQERGHQKFLEFLSAAMTTPDTALTVLGLADPAAGDRVLADYLPKLTAAPNYYLTW